MRGDVGGGWRGVEGVGGWSPDTPGQLQCKAQGGEPSQGKAGQGSNPKEAKLRQAECKTELQHVELVQTSTEKIHGKRNFQNLNAFFVTFPSYMHWAF